MTQLHGWEFTTTGMNVLCRCCITPYPTNHWQHQASHQPMPLHLTAAVSCKSWMMPCPRSCCSTCSRLLPPLPRSGLSTATDEWAISHTSLRWCAARSRTGVVPFGTIHYCVPGQCSARAVQCQLLQGARCSNRFPALLTGSITCHGVWSAAPTMCTNVVFVWKPADKHLHAFLIVLLGQSSCLPI